jgi:hypothetical protein
MRPTSADFAFTGYSSSLSVFSSQQSAAAGVLLLCPAPSASAVYVYKKNPG